VDAFGSCVVLVRVRACVRACVREKEKEKEKEMKRERGERDRD
jgi:hypothetical protein